MNGQTSTVASDPRRLRVTIEGPRQPTEVAINLRRQSVVPHECRISVSMYDGVFGDRRHRQRLPKNLWNFHAKCAILATIIFCPDGTAYPSTCGCTEKKFGSPIIPSSRSFPTLLNDSNLCPSIQEICKKSSLTYLSPLLFLKN